LTWRVKIHRRYSSTLCSIAAIKPELRSPLDEAILRYKEINTDNYQRIDEIPFDFVRKRLSIVVKENQENLIVTKGAPEEIF